MLLQRLQFIRNIRFICFIIYLLVQMRSRGVQIAIERVRVDSRLADDAPELADLPLVLQRSQSLVLLVLRLGLTKRADLLKFRQIFRHPAVCYIVVPL